MINDAQETEFELVKQPKNSFYLGGNWGHCLDLLQHLCQFSDSVLFVIGSHGIGKTTLIAALRQKLGHMLNFATIAGNTDTNLQTVVEKLSRDLNLQEASYKNMELLDRLILIDDAELYSFEIIEALIKLKVKKIFFGTEELARILQEPKINHLLSGKMHTLEIEPLTFAETEAFLLHKWHEAQNQAVFPFNQAALKCIYTLSGGIPQAILQQAQNYLAGAINPKKFEFKTKLVMSIIGASIGCAIIIGVFLSAKFFGHKVEQDAKAHIEEEAAQEVLPEINTDKPQARGAQNDFILQANIDPAKASARALELGIASEIKQQATEQEQYEQETETADNNNDIANNREQLQSSLQQTASSGLVDNKKVITVEPKAAIVIPQAVEPTQSNITVATTAPKDSTKNNSKSNYKTNINAESKKPAPTAKAEPKKLQGGEAKNKNLSKAEQQMLKTPAGYYTLQLIGCSDLNKLLAFMKQHNIQKHASYYTSVKNGKPWFVLLYGKYPNKDLAIKAKAALSKELQSLSPWLRDFASVHKILEKKQTKG